jgi:hypothetical protein
MGIFNVAKDVYNYGRDQANRYAVKGLKTASNLVGQARTYLDSGSSIPYSSSISGLLKHVQDRLPSKEPQYDPKWFRMAKWLKGKGQWDPNIPFPPDPRMGKPKEVTMNYLQGREWAMANETAGFTDYSKKPEYKELQQYYLHGRKKGIKTPMELEAEKKEREQKRDKVKAKLMSYGIYSPDIGRWQKAMDPTYKPKAGKGFSRGFNDAAWAYASYDPSRFPQTEQQTVKPTDDSDTTRRKLLWNKKVQEMSGKDRLIHAGSTGLASAAWHGLSSLGHPIAGAALGTAFGAIPAWWARRKANSAFKEAYQDPIVPKNQQQIDAEAQAKAQRQEQDKQQFGWFNY